MCDPIGSLNVGSGPKSYSKPTSYNWSLARHYNYPNQVNSMTRKTLPQYDISPLSHDVSIKHKEWMKSSLYNLIVS